MQARRIGHFGFFRRTIQATLWHCAQLLHGLPYPQGDKRASIATATLNSVATIEIARPLEKKNALTVAMYQAIRCAQRAAQADRRCAVLITSQPGIFTSGTFIEV